MKIILTIDLEFWYNSKFLKNYLPKEDELANWDLVMESTVPILNLLKEKKAKATFFTLGKLAEKHPDLIKRISGDGHEIASHGYSHKPLWEITPEEFEKEIILSKKILYEIIKKEPTGFRAPNFSLTPFTTKWALPILEKYNFKYDASLFPSKTPIGGIYRTPNDTFKTSPDEFAKIDKKSNLYEFPSLIWGDNLRFPTPSGSIYFRILPLWIYLKFLKSAAKNKKAPVIHFHNHELYNWTPPIKLPFIKRRIKYWGVKNSFEKFSRLLDKFDFISIEEYLGRELQG